MTNTPNDGILINFWGTRGTLAAPGKNFGATGGNTNCIEVICGGEHILFDAGTGARQLGGKIVAQRPTEKLNLLLTHAHYDHVEGIPFFAPFFDPTMKIDVYCGELDGALNTKGIVNDLMQRPYFPVGPEVFAADITYHDLGISDRFELSDDIKIRTCPLNHPGGATAYRIDYGKHSFACVTDTENIPGKHDEIILELIDGVDLFVYDASLTDEELPDFEGYGHSTHEEAVRLCKLAKAGGVLATHHMPFRTDDALDEIERDIYGELENSGIAREGDTIHLK